MSTQIKFINKIRKLKTIKHKINKAKLIIKYNKSNKKRIKIIQIKCK